ncbi:thiol reductant ABC exporter subunit CydC [Finegoldia magna]|uniref:thiol reductant ABC exporter subunit CydC n=2 Tax=Finegoldia magna TaxID=1260 RepID=UPI0001DE49C1|nr:thiol reductant ABC exporter subunit CydC [Finegoldia magna]EFK93963.1 ABC transporter, ATP-binding protein [Finegoldia magna ACS-171-V-Col3]MDU5186209.1 thiol reductant ABC exporter subunit CydC [Finegoldia magna]MDU6598929.1 thiol reductant ABC exporter subunit CydC [Finegoldia magna]
MRRSGFNIMMKLITLVKPLIGFMFLAIIAGVIGNLAAIFIPAYSSYVIANIVSRADQINLNMSFILLIVLAISRGFLRYVEQLCNHFIAFKLLAIIRNKVFRALRRLAPAKLEGKEKGNLISLITSDIELLEVFYAHTISPIFIAFITSVIVVSILFAYSVKAAIFAMISYLIVGLFLPIFSSKSGKNEGLELRNEFADLNSYLLDSLRGMKEVIQYSYGEKRLDYIDETTVKLNRKQERIKVFEAQNRGFTTSIVALLGLIMFVIMKNEMVAIFDINKLIVVTVLFMSSFGPVIALSSLSANLRSTFASGDRVLNILEEKPQVLEVYDQNKTYFSDLKIEDITFSYNDEIILNDFNLSLENGEKLAIFGKSGSGKSTLLKLIMRFWDVDKGEIKISDKNIKQVNTKDLRDIENYMTQETYLFQGSILENIKIAKKDASLNEVIEACKKASIHDFICSLKDGYETNVGELGEKLSSGEKQRIGLARVFLHDAPLYILDEPTSNLDALNEGIILNAISKEENKSMLIVSHRKSALNIADKTIEIKTKRNS